MRGGRASGRLDHGFFCAIFGRASGQKNRKKIQGNLSFWAIYIGIPGLIQKLKVSKCVCRSTLASVCNGQPFSPYLAPLGAKYLEKGRKNIKKSIDFCLFGAFPIGMNLPGEAVKKSAASAASLDGFSSRDQVGC